LAEPEQALWFAFKGDRLLVYREGPVRVPLAGDPGGFNLDVRFRWKLGDLDGHPCWAVEADPDVAPPEGMAFRDLRSFFFGVDEDFFRVAGRAKQMVGWHTTHRFCGRCGGETEPAVGELAKRCTRCGMLHYPRLSPAAIVLVEKGERVLLARSPAGPSGALAGLSERPL
jgi:NAD+ diphosphatase